ncbi:glycosyltransferase family 2 protein [Paenibacillus sp. URB8-2]|uniref:glycosyltransferase family 2 protein n=1 Tax=Paenibacillus sp. URB8-2 TaxID=2741301 RepID=UPI0015BBA2EC|nr:glycosyltransferase family A protein [Paenibacillus sp. URB8-2]BCG60550.1 glycosyl transferase [Paenibacillus sp. URB8-2]
MCVFSIIVPCFNLENIINITIESVLSQSFEDFELIVIDDGSTDKTLEVVKKYKQKDKRIKIISKENGGVSSARNNGISSSLGEYILFLDGDDKITSDLLKNADEILKDKDIDMYSFGYIHVCDNHIIKKYQTLKFDEGLFSNQQFLKLFLTKKISQCMCSFIIKKNIIKNNALYFDENTKYTEDQEFQIKCINHCRNIYYDSTIYFYYIQREGSAINNRVIRENFDVYFRLSSLISDELKSEYENYLCILFVYNFREILNKGSDEKTVSKLLSIDFVLKNYKFQFTKHNVLVGLFILLYKLRYKTMLEGKYLI